MRLYYVFLILLILPFQGLYASTYTVSNVARAQVSTQGILATLRAKAIINNSPSFISRIVNIGKSSIAFAVRKRIFSPWGVALAASYIAADYFFDESTQEIRSGTPAGTDIGSCTYNSGGNNNMTASACLALANLALGGSTTAYMDDVRLVSGYRYIYDLKRVDNNVVLGFWEATFDVGIDPEGTEQVVPDAEISDFFTQNATQTEIQDLLLDPVTGLPDTDITEIADIETDINEDYDLLNDGDPLTNPDIDPLTGDTGLQTETEIEPAEEDICITNPALLQCLEVGEEIIDTTVPVENFNYSFSPFSLSSSGSCPAPLSSTLLNGYVVNFEYTFLCTFATTIRFLILAICSLVALRLMSGAIRQ